MERRKPPSPEQKTLLHLRELLGYTTEMTKPPEKKSINNLLERMKTWEEQEKEAKRIAAYIAIIIMRNPTARQTLQDEIARLGVKSKSPSNTHSYVEFAVEMINHAEKAALAFALQKIAERRNKL